MAKIHTLKCPSCGGTFDWLQHPSDEPPPRFCQLCGFDSQTDNTAIEFHPAITTPMIRNPKHQSGDMVYRAYEESTAANARAAAEIAGTTVAEQSNLKVTDFDTQVRQGDLSVKPIVNDVSRFMDAHPQVVQQANNPAQAMQYAAMAHAGAGPDAYAGAKAMAAARAIHAEHGANIVASQQTRPKGQGPSVPSMISEMPTLEVHNRAMARGTKRTF